MNEALAELVLELAVGDYAGIRNEYRTRFYAAILDYLGNGANKTRKRNEAKKSVTDAFNTTADLGFQDGGGELPDPDLTEWIDTRMRMEWANVDALFDLLSTLRKDPEFTQQDAYDIANRRADGYVTTLDSIYNEAKVRAAGNVMLTFGGQDGHTPGFPCPECRKLKGKRHRASWWISRGLVPYPGNMNYTCGNWQCKHFLYDDQGRIFTV